MSVFSSTKKSTKYYLREAEQVLLLLELSTKMTKGFCYTNMILNILPKNFQEENVPKDQICMFYLEIERLNDDKTKLTFSDRPEIWYTHSKLNF